MPKGKFHRAKGRPLHRQVHDFLLQRISSGFYVTGDKLGTEVALAAELKVSTITCRRALQDLAAGGYITRTPRRGSVVQPIPSSASLSGSLDRLLDDVRLRRTSAEFKVGKAELVRPPEEVRRAFGADPGILLRRSTFVIRRNKVAVAHLTVWTLEDLARLIAPQGIAKKARLALLRDAGVKIARVVQTVAGHPAPAGVSGKIGVRKGSVTTRMTRTVFDTRGRVVELVVAYSPWNRYEYRVILQ